MRLNLSSLIQLKCNIKLYLFMGWNRARNLVFFLGRLHFFFNRKEKKSIEDAVSKALEKKGRTGSLSYIKKKVFDGILSHYYEKMFIAFEKPSAASGFLKRHVITDELEIIREKLVEKKGVILVTGHYGAIEFIPVLLATNHFPVSIIAKFKTAQLKKKSFRRLKNTASG